MSEASAAAAEGLITEVADLMEKLRDLVEQETAFVRAGKVRNAAALASAKSELAARLFTAGERLKAQAKTATQAAPDRAAKLRRQHEEFLAALQRNMNALSTAHAVSEGIVRRLSGELARNAAPRVYGASGKTLSPNPKQGKPLAISRVL
jgi:flagellar biosynthesis/type III secretory pathway chaperone